MGHEEHKSRAVKSVNCAVITVSDTRTEDTDASGKMIMALLREGSHKVSKYLLARDDPAEIRRLLSLLSAEPDLEAIILNGGTGISRRDSTFEAVASLLEKKIDGFGEIFRYLCYGEIGSAAMMSRAVAGVINGKIVISMPGSEGAVRLAMTRLVIPELAHMVWEVNR